MVPLVSFIVAARDASSTLPAALDSLAAQSVADFEIVVVDDASSQPLEELVDFKAYECLRLLRSSRPLGRSAARNAAIQEAKGKFVAIQDADDVSAPNRLALQLDLMDANSSVVACSGQLIQFCDDQYWRGPSWPTASGDLRREFERGRMRLAHPASMMRRAEVVKAGGYDLSLDISPTPGCRRASSDA
jgi:teichuronic acid biosynthesis glycosyltransferase TuaG